MRKIYWRRIVDLNMKAKPIKLPKETRDYLPDLGVSKDFLSRALRGLITKEKELIKTILFGITKFLSIKRHHKESYKATYEVREDICSTCICLRTPWWKKTLTNFKRQNQNFKWSRDLSRHFIGKEAQTAHVCINRYSTSLVIREMVINNHSGRQLLPRQNG